ncbi:hypothetical protein Goshw_026724 [Gossypium schwendimanii]|uniref:Uncharacterized protein n=1 Tax=Gossypium schwendimanii TaxID=34291 RepID=A0A7J9MWM1_GOSSC|nr:hypothetical protein [Gossypium schwendimanii]
MSTSGSNEDDNACLVDDRSTEGEGENSKEYFYFEEEDFSRTTFNGTLAIDFFNWVKNY